MNISKIIKAPAGVQFNRVVFTIYAMFFAWPIGEFRHFISISGLMIFSGFVFCSLLDLGYSFVRLPRSRWVLAVLNLLIPAVFWGLMCVTEFSHPTSWWERVLEDALALGIWFSYPIALVVSLFRDKKTSEYFEPQAGLEIERDISR